MFKRRERRTWWEATRAFLWPKGGWGRASRYVKLRLWRLPDSPSKIARGIWAGVFVTFSPLYGLHFLCSAVLAFIMRGNVLAALLATFVGNPLTFPAIGWMSLQVGNYLLGRPLLRWDDWERVGKAFGDAWRDLKFNFWAMFNEDRADWRGLFRFYEDIFFPYLIGGIIPGIIFATLFYIWALPVIAAFQENRRKKLREKLAQLQPGAKGDESDDGST